MRWEWGRGDVLLADGREVGGLRKAVLLTRAEVEVNGQVWAFRAEGRELRGFRDGTPLLRAHRPSFLSSTQEITTPSGSYTLKRAGWLSSRLRLLRDGVAVGDVARAASWSNRPRLETTTDLPAEDAVFVLWVAHVLRSRDDGGASAATHGGAAT